MFYTDTRESLSVSGQRFSFLKKGSNSNFLDITEGYQLMGNDKEFRDKVLKQMNTVCSRF